MSKRTVFITHVDWEKSEFFIKNQGIEEISLFKKLRDNGIEFKDEDISNEEMCMLLNYLCVDGIIECVFSIENHFNRDQSTMNPVKRNIAQKYKARGLMEVTHCDWSPSFCDGSNTINSRNYLTILIENIKRKELEYEKIGEEFEEYKNEINVEKSKIDASLETYEQDKKEKINKEIDILQDEINKNTQKIKQQNWYIEKTKDAEKEYNEVKEKLDKEIERYKKGKEYNDTMFKNLPIEIQELIEQKKSIENEIDNFSHYLTSLEDDERLLQKEIEKEKQTYLRLKTIEYENLMKDIKELIEQKQWTKKEALARFDTACQMYLLNGRNLPEFEKEFAKKEGLSDDEIVSILNKYI